MGEEFDISRVGTDGKLDAAIAMVRELDGNVDAIGLGGIDVYLYAGRHRYALRDGLRLLEAAKITPIVDGSGLKNTLEREAVRFMQDELGIDLRGKSVLMVSALDRFGMAQALVDAGADVLFGDFIFALDKDMPVRELHEFEQLAEKYLPDACKLPFQFFYPTGKKQDKPPEPKYPQYYEQADIIAGDFHFMRQFMPDRLDGKIDTYEYGNRTRRRRVGGARRLDADHDDARVWRPLVRNQRSGGGAGRFAGKTLERRAPGGLRTPPCGVASAAAGGAPERRARLTVNDTLTLDTRGRWVYSPLECQGAGLPAVP